MTVIYIFIALRLVDGIFLGGEYTSANTLAMEYCPKEKRGFYGAADPERRLAWHRGDLARRTRGSAVPAGRRP